jgi:diguanylate cyclase (GGDEF)-like protein/PAS domain S-box-containing protein
LFLCTQTELAPADAAKCDAVGREPAIAFDGLGEGILLLDRDGGIVAVNAAFESICNYSPAEVVGRTQDFLDSPLHGREFYAERERIVEETGYWRGEAWHRLRNGLSVPHFQTISRIDDGDARSRHYVITFRTALKKRDLERLRFLSNRDALTGLPNRTSFAEEVGAAVERAALAGGGCAVLAIHLDRFKLINDSLGGTAADRLLRTQAERLHDYIGERGLVGGGGRGEFLLLVEDLRSDKEAEIIVREVATALSRPIDIEGQEVAVNVSVGFSCFPGDGDEAVRLIANAQAALLEPDGGGSCSYRRFAREMNVHSVARFNIGNRLRSAIEREELILHYQPKVSLATGTITGLEALVRWHRPREGYVSPAVFIPIAEETRLIETIGEWVLETACRQMRVWQRMGIAPARMAVNLSPHQFRQVDLLDRIVAVLGATGLDPTAFEAEITESSTMSDPEAAIQLMDALYDMGITLAIDDFGTGYSSLTYLKRFPINSIKIDQSFVRGLPRDMNDIAIVEAVIALAKSLSFGLVAEGVETEEQRNFLFERGCEEMQGYLFSRPRSATEVEPLLRASALAARQAVSA